MNILRNVDKKEHIGELSSSIKVVMLKSLILIHTVVRTYF